MHFSAKSGNAGIGIACRPSVRPSVTIGYPGSMLPVTAALLTGVTASKNYEYPS